jgi:hypothetical protein
MTGMPLVDPPGCVEKLLFFTLLKGDRPPTAFADALIGFER